MSGHFPSATQGHVCCRRGTFSRLGPRCCGGWHSLVRTVSVGKCSHEPGLVLFWSVPSARVGSPHRWLIMAPAQKMLLSRKGSDSLSPSGSSRAGDRLPLGSISRGPSSSLTDPRAQAVTFPFPYSPRRAKPVEGKRVFWGRLQGQEGSSGETPGASPLTLSASVPEIPLTAPTPRPRHGLEGTEICTPAAVPHGLHGPLSLMKLSVPPAEGGCVGSCPRKGSYD